MIVELLNDDPHRSLADIAVIIGKSVSAIERAGANF